MNDGDLLVMIIFCLVRSGGPGEREGGGGGRLLL